MTKTLLLISALLSIKANPVMAQTNKINGLKTIYFNSVKQAQRADAALAICAESHSLNNDTLFYYASVAKKIADQLKDKERQTLAHVYIETYLTRMNRFDSTLKMCDADLEHLDYEHNRDAYAKTMMQKCFCLARANRNRTSLDLTYAFLADADKYSDTVSQMYAKTLIGIVYRNMEQTELAMTWFQKADATTANPSYEAVKNDFGIYFLLGMMYNWRLYLANSTRERLQDSVKTIYFLDRAIADSRKYENLSILAKTLNVKAATIGNKEHVAAEGVYVKEAAAIYAELNDTSSMLNTISPMCFYYIDEGHPEKGIEACKNGIEIASHNNSYPVIDLYGALGDCYLAEKDYRDYAATLNDIIRVKDSTYKVNTEQDLAEMNARYEDQKKENIIIKQKLDITSKKYSILLISIATGILLAGIFLLYRYYTRKQKKLKLQAEAAVITAQEAERKRISADLHDNIGAYAAAAASTIGTISASNEQSHHRLGLLKNNIQDMISQLNDSIWALNKKEMLLTSVSDRFKTFAQKLEPSYPNITVLIDEKIEEDQLLTSFHALHLFRIMQEAFNNALRHSRGTHIHIEIESCNGNIKFIISDDGIGMTSAKINGNGINNLKLRAAELGWSAQWISNDTGGTSVIIDSGDLSPTTNSAFTEG